VGRKTVNESAGTYEVHPHQAATWNRQAREGLKALFERKHGGRRTEGRDGPGRGVRPDRAAARAGGVVEKSRD